MSYLDIDRKKIEEKVFQTVSENDNKEAEIWKAELNGLMYCVNTQLLVIREQEAKIIRIEEQHREDENTIKTLLMENLNLNKEIRKLQADIEELKEQIKKTKDAEIPLPPLLSTVLTMLREGATNKKIAGKLHEIGYSWSVMGAVLHPDPVKELAEKGDRSFIQYARNLC